MNVKTELSGRARVSRGLIAMVVAGLAATACTIETRAERGRAADAGGFAQGPLKQIIQPEGVPRLPVFSSAVRSGDYIFLSGAIGALPGVTPPTLVEGGIQAEAKMAMDNLGTVLEAAGAGWGDVVKCTVFLADMSEYAAFNEVYVGYFPSDPPARSAMAVAGLVFDARVEVECIAAAERNPSR